MIEDVQRSSARAQEHSCALANRDCCSSINAGATAVALRTMLLYVCAFEKAGAPVHPCAKAATALDKAGHSYELRKVKGGSLKPWTWASRARDRAEVEQLSGQRAVPILVLDDGEVIAGSGEIADWARSHAPSGP